MHVILIIDDDPALCSSLSTTLEQEGYSVASALNGTEGMDQAETLHPDLIILAMHLPDRSGFDVLDFLHSLCPPVPVICTASAGNTEAAIDAIQKGAYDFIYKPFNPPEMVQLVRSGLLTGTRRSEPVMVNPESDDFSGHDAIVGNCRQMLEVYKAIGKVSSTDATVLIRGESGTGKELASRAIYNHSDRAGKPFVVINCVAIPESLLESELFGYEKGSFTGADHRKIGKIEQARGGTVFLDEIGDMPLSTQAKLLRLLQENSIERIGGKEPIDVDVRILAATNKNLENAVAEGTFREDLYYRLRVVTITMPPLRERREDMDTLINYLLTRLSRQMSIPSPGITRAAVHKIMAYDWPGNIRELSNTLKKTLIFNRGAPIQQEDITFSNVIRCPKEDHNAPAEHVQNWIHSVLASGRQHKSFEFCVDYVAALLVKEALDLTKGNRSQAARLLGISRPTLHAKMDKYNIDRP